MNELTMPKLGLTMEEGAVAQWHKNPGEPFREGEPLFAVETDKATLDVEAESDGVLVEVLVPVGEKVSVGVPIARIETGNEPPVTKKPSAAQSTTRAQEAARAISTSESLHSSRIAASPAVRRRAQELGVDLATIHGSGPSGRIILRDLPEASSREASQPSLTHVPGRDMALTPMRRAIAASMSEAAAIPQFRVTRSADMTRTLALRDALQPILDRDRIRLSVADFLIQACALALSAHPEVNASYLRHPHSQDEIRLHDGIHIGVAMAMQDGLIAPVLRNAERMTLIDVAKRRRELTDTARSGRLNAQDMADATFTLSNLGPMGVDQFDAIVTPPQAAVLAAGRVMQRPVAHGTSGVELRPTIILTVTADHRVIDGAQAAAFLGTIAKILEDASRYRLFESNG